MVVSPTPLYRSVVVKSHQGRLAGYVAIASVASFAVPGLLSTESYSTVLLLLPLLLIIASIAIYFRGRQIFYAEFYEDFLILKKKNEQIIRNVKYEDIEFCRLRQLTSRSGLFVVANVVNLKLKEWIDEVQISNLEIKGKWRRDKDKILELYDWLLKRTKKSA